MVELAGMYGVRRRDDEDVLGDGRESRDLQMTTLM